MRRPWNLVNSPVYSLATYCDDLVNMNIATYVVPVSMRPKMYVIGIYLETRTLDFSLQSDFAVLQLLGHSHKTLVPSLGQRSGRHFDKMAHLEKLNMLTHWKGRKILTDCKALLLLEKKGHLDIGGDHELFWYQVVSSKSLDDSDILYFHDLISEGLIL